MRGTLLAWSVLGAVLASGTPAAAHVGEVPAGIDALGPGAPVVETSVGLLVPDGDVHRWVCHEAVVQSDFFLTPRYARSPDGVLMTALGLLDVGTDPRQSVYRSEDGGCTWAAPEGLTDRVVVDLALGPGDAGLAVTGRPPGDPEFPGNTIFVTDDGGGSWGPSDVDRDPRTFRTVATSPDGATSWATSIRYTPPGAWIHRSVDGGETWQESAHDFVLAGERWTVLDVLLPHPDDPEAAWIRQAGEQGDRLYLATAGGATLEELVHLPGADGLVHDAAWYRGDLFVAGSDGVLVFPEGRGSPSAWPGTGEPVRGLSVEGDVLHLVHGDVGGHVMTTLPAETFLDFSTVTGPPACAEDATATVRCGPLWDDLAARLQPPPDPTPAPSDVPPPSDGCPAGPAAALALLVPLGARRP